MKYADHPKHSHGAGCCEGITAPFCPPPLCIPNSHIMSSEDCCCSAGQQPSCKQPLSRAAVWPRPVKPCPPRYDTGVVCSVPLNKPVKPHCESVLLQKIIACEKRSIPQLCTRIEPKELPSCACPPFTLVSLTQSGAQPWWSPMESCGPDTRNRIRVFIPVCCQICDGEGRHRHANAVVEVETGYRPPCQSADRRESLFLVPCLRLTGGDLCSEEPAFCVQLEISLEIYVLRPEPCAMHRSEAMEKELPLYPQPVCRYKNRCDQW